MGEGFDHKVSSLPKSLIYQIQIIPHSLVSPPSSLFFESLRGTPALSCSESHTGPHRGCSLNPSLAVFQKGSEILLFMDVKTVRIRRAPG